MDGRTMRTTVAAAAGAVVLLLGGCTSDGGSGANGSDSVSGAGGSGGGSGVSGSDSVSGVSGSDTVSGGASPQGSTAGTPSESDSSSPSGPPNSSSSPVTSGSDHAGSSASSSSAESSSTTESADGSSGAGVNAHLEAAAAFALDQGPSGGVLTSIESEKDGTQWEVKIVTDDGAEHRLMISRDGTSVLSSGPEKTSDSEKAKYRGRVKAASLDYGDAIDALIAKVPDGRIDELQLDESDSGVVVWEADVYGPNGSKQELDVDASTGDVVSG